MKITNRMAFAVMARAIFEEFGTSGGMEYDPTYMKDVAISAREAGIILDAYARSAGRRGKIGLAKVYETNSDKRFFGVMKDIRDLAENDVSFLSFNLDSSTRRKTIKRRNKK